MIPLISAILNKAVEFITKDTANPFKMLLRLKTLVFAVFIISSSFSLSLTGVSGDSIPELIVNNIEAAETQAESKDVYQHTEAYIQSKVEEINQRVPSRVEEDDYLDIRR